MEKYFCNYNQSMDLKSISFDEPSLCVYAEGRKQFIINNTIRNWNDQLKNGNTTSAPLKSQVFEWFREKHNLLNEICFYRCDRRTKKSYWFTIFKWDDKMVSREIIRDKNDTYYSTYEEAESACIDKLIELVKNGR